MEEKNQSCTEAPLYTAGGGEGPGVRYPTNRNKNHSHKITGLLVLCFIVNLLQAQNINHPNKMGPLGTEVNTASGNLFLRRPDMQVPVRGLMNNLYLMFDYNSFDFNTNIGYGNGWTFVYDMRYRADTAGTITIIWGDNREDRYTLSGSGYQAPAGIFDQLSQYQSGKFRLTTKQGIAYYFDNSQHRRLTRIADPNSNALTMSYTDSLVTGISSTAGQAITLSYMTGKLMTVTDAMASPSRSWSYTYDAANNLTKVTDPLGGLMQYRYLTNGPMSGMTDKNMNEVNIIYYSDFSVSELIGCNSRKSFSYDTTLHRTTVTDYLPNAANQVTTYTYQYYGNLVWLTNVTGNCCGNNTSSDYDAAGNVVKRTDANGAVFTYTYDSRGNILSVTDPLSQVMRYTYSSDFNRITGFTDFKGYVHTLEYDNRGNIMKLTEPGGLVYTGTYSTNGDLLTSTDPKGNKFTYAYDSYGHLLNMVGSNGFSTSYTYDTRGNLLTVTDARGNTFTGQYDLLNRLKMITDPLNEVQKMTYDAAGNLTSMVNRNNETSTLGYDASNRIVRLTDENGKSSYMTYDAMDNITGYTNRVGNKATYSYDNRNRISAVKDPAGNTNTFDYDAVGNLTAVGFPNGRIVTKTYDGIGRIIRQSDGTGTIGSVTYDANNNVTSYTNATGSVSSATYDNLNRMTSFIDPLGNTERYTYDANDNITAWQNRNGNTSTSTYDSLDRIKTQTDNGGGNLIYNYDGYGNITGITDQNNHTTTYTYDSLNRSRRTTYADGKYMELSYDVKGNVIAKRMGDGLVITYTYDSLNRVRSKSIPGTSPYTYTYDAASRLLTATNASGTTSFTYDALNRVSSETFNGRTTSYVYNVSGRTLTTFYPDSTVVIKSFDTRNRLVAISRNGGAIATYQYDASDRLTGISYGNGVNTAMQYDFNSRLTGISSGNGNVQNKLIGYDAVGNKLSVNDMLNAQQSELFTYDTRNRLVGYKRGQTGGTDTVNRTFTYDAVGNRTSVVSNGVTTSYTVNSLNQLTAASGGTTASYTYDDRGNLIFDGTFYKKYNAAGQLLLDSASVSNKTAYLYDGVGRRIRKVVNGSPLNYYYNGLSQIMQTDGNTDTTLNKTVFGAFILPVALDKAGKTYQYHFNELYSVDALTGSSGSVAERYRYAPYGNTTIFDSAGNTIAASAVGNRFGYTGQEYDKETGTYHFHYRNYQPATGTFEQRDPLGYADQMGLYQYVDDNPASGIDVLGLAPCPPTYVSQSTTVIGHSNNWTAIANYLAQLKRIKDELGKTTGINDAGESLSERSSKFSKFNLIQQVVNLELAANKYLQDEPYLTTRGQHTRLAELETSMAGLTGDILSTKVPGNPYSKATTLIGVADALSSELTGNSLAKNYADLDIGAIQRGNRLLKQAEERYKWDQKRIDAARKLFGDDVDKWTDELKETYERHMKAAKTYTRTETTDWIEGYDPDNCPPYQPNGTQKPPPVPNPPGTPVHTEVINSKDPNEIIGPDGVGIPKWVSVKDNLPYLINYENSRSASAPAKTVRIIYPIDPKQDKNTFTLGSYGFNNQTYPVPASTNAYYQRLDVRDSLGLYVDVTAGLDVQNNQAFWFFQSIDPATLLPTTAPLAGFLSLQDTASLNKGHGFVNFTIKPLSTDVTGDTMHAYASIVFDGNDTIPTNYAKNTIDAVAPTSHMNSAPSVSYTNTFPLSWSGADDAGASGLRSYALYYSVNGGVYMLLRSGITRQDTTFTGSNGNTYRFFVLATDSTGNVEALKSGAEVTVLVSSTTLPITWQSFTAVLQGKNGLLNWATGSEAKSNHFAVERSVNGRSFTQIGMVTAAGYSTTRRDYRFIDSNVVSLNIPLVYYRIRQVDNDGAYTYSNVVAVPLPTANLKPSVEVYPNPFKQTLNLLLVNLPSAAGDNVSLYTIDGKQVYSKALGSRGTSANITLDDLPQLPQGIYLLKITSGKEVFNFKLMRE